MTKCSFVLDDMTIKSHRVCIST